VRPALVLLDAGDNDFVAAPVTSQSRGSRFDLPIREWRKAGLNVTSTVRLHKLTVLAKDEIIRSLGTLGIEDHQALSRMLQDTFCVGE
jgi:mRNA-degrading endonuclease toxin of MazEF toxin-antitoxin module